MKRSIIELERSLNRKNMDQKSPGQILQGVALGVKHHNNRIVRTNFRQMLDVSEYCLWKFIDDLLSYNGETPKIIGKKKEVVKTTKELYSKALNEIRSRDLVINGGIEKLVNQFEGNLDINNKKISNAGITVYSPHEFAVFASGREKTVEKVAEKISLNLALAYAYNKGIRIEKNYIDNPCEEAHVEKSRIEDFFGGRIVFKDTDSMYLHLNMDPEFQSMNNVIISMGNNRNDNDFWGRQKEEGYPFFKKDKTNGYKSFHFNIRNENFRTINFEIQMLPYTWFLFNEGSSIASHRGYDLTIKEVIDSLPEEIAVLRKQFDHNIKHFYKEVRPYDLCRNNND